MESPKREATVWIDNRVLIDKANEKDYHDLVENTRQDLNDRGYEWVKIKVDLKSGPHQDCFRCSPTERQDIDDIIGETWQEWSDRI